MSIPTSVSRCWFGVGKVARSSGLLELLEPRCVLAAGDLDLGFGGDGKVSTGFTSIPLLDFGRDAAIDASGRIVLVGSALDDGLERYAPDFAIARLNTDGTPDLTFGFGGQVLTDFGGSFRSHEQVNAVAIQADGKLVVAGRADVGNGFDFALARYHADGSLDVTFGTGGLVVTPSAATGDDEIFDVAIDSTGKLVVAGRSGGQFALARYTATGALDAAFGTGGLVHTDFAGSGGAYSVLIQPDGKIVAAGSDGTDFALARYDGATGALDMTFGASGKVLTNFSFPQPGIDSLDIAHAIARQSDGSLVVAGESNFHFALARYDTNGALDATFSGGLVTSDFGETTGAFRGVALDSGGNIVATGAHDSNVTVVRYTPSGIPDITFGGAGGVIKSIDTGADSGSAVVLQADGRIVIAGSTANSAATVKDAAVLRYDATGVLDPMFSSDGIARIDFLGHGDSFGNAVAVQTDGRVIVAGSAATLPGQADEDFALTRYNVDGSLDTTFGNGGHVLTAFAAGDKDQIHAIAIHNSQIVVLGTTGFDDVALARYDMNGTLDATFGTGGKVVTSFTAQEENGYALLIQSDDKIVVGGNTNLGDFTHPAYDAALFRYDTSGALDATFGTGGRVLFDVGGAFDRTVALGEQSGGKLVVGLTGPVDEFIVGRFNANGSRDTSFGTFNGLAHTPVGSRAGLTAIEVLADDSILAGGVGALSFALAKFTSDGAVDATFGNAGVSRPRLGEESNITSLALAAGGKFLAAGHADGDAVVARFDANGSLDGTFGDRGSMSVDLGGTRDVARGIALASDGRAAVAGTFRNGRVQDMGAFVLQPDVVPPAQGALRFSAAVSNVAENAGMATITVTRVGGSTGAVDVSYATSDDTATAGIGKDYTAASGTLHFADMQTSATFDVPILTDAIEEGAETILLNLSMPTNGAVLDNPHLARLVIAGEATPAGLLDPAFGDHGTAQTGIELQSQFFDEDAVDLALQADGKIVAAGVTKTNGDFLVARFNSDGTPDGAFGNLGTVQTDFAADSDAAHAVLVLPDGRIVVAGEASFGTPGFESNHRPALTRLLPDGTLDTTFGTLGRAVLELGDEISILDSALTPDGKILLAGSVFTDATVRYDFCLIRVNSDGSLDTSFGNGGKVVTDFGGLDNELSSITVLPEGRILAIGTADTHLVNNSGQYAIARYNADGTLDTTFDSDGRVLVDVTTSEDTGRAAAVQTDGKIVVVGDANRDFGVVRLLANGALDTSFDGDGMTRTAFGSPTFDDDIANSVIVQPDGKIVVGGTNGTFGNAWAIARYNPDGSLNTSFVGTGKVLIPFTSDHVFGNEMLLQADGKIVVGGTSEDALGKSRLSLARLLNDPRPGALQFSAGMTRVDENAGDATITVARIGGTTGAVTVHYATADGTALGGSDYATTSGTLMFADGEAFKTFAVPLIDNNAAEGPETVKLTLDTPGGGAVLGLQSFSTLTIVDGPGRIQFGQPTFFVGEDAGTALVTIERADGSDGTASVRFFSGIGSAAAGADFDPLAVTVNFADGERSRTVAVPVFDDDLLEGRETVPLGLSAVTGATLGLANATLVLYDHESGQPHNPGALDNGFAGDGIATADFAMTEDAGAAMVVQPDGKIVVAGTADAAGAADFGVARFKADGTLDTSFSGDGKLTTNFGGIDRATGAALLDDGRIVVAGYTIQNGRANFALARYLTDGSLDTTFDGDGMLTTDFAGADDRALAVTIDASGRIVVAGSTGGVFARDFALARYNPDGSLDATFDGDGRVETDFGNNTFDVARALTITADGKIVAVGGTTQEAPGAAIVGLDNFALARFNANGSLDKTFDGDGRKVQDFDALFDNDSGNVERASAVIAMPNGDLLVGGTEDNNFLITRFKANGALDPDFGTSGFGARLDFGAVSFAGTFDTLHALALQPDGKILAAGQANFGLAVARLMPDGTMDRSFGVEGLQTIDAMTEGRAVAWHDARIYVGGTAGEDFAVARLLADSAAPINGTFNFGALQFGAAENAGTATITVTRPFDAAFGTVTVDYAATGITAVAGVDFTPVSGTLTFAEGESSKTFSVPLIDDMIRNGNQSVRLILSSPTGGAELGSVSQSTLTIADNETGTGGTFSMFSSSVIENAGMATITVSRFPAGVAASVSYATSDGTAQSGDDFTAVSGTLNFGANDTSKSFNIPITDDQLIEGDETLNVTLFNPTGTTIGTRTAAVTIIDFESYTSHNAADLDTTFDGDGKVTTDFGFSADSISAMVAQADGKIVVAGHAGPFDDGSFALARYNTDGSLDATFGTGGMVTTDLRGGADSAMDLFLTTGGKLVAAGTSFDAMHGSLSLARYNANGKLDTSFGKGGLAVFDFPNPFFRVVKFSMEPDGRIVAAVETQHGGDDLDFEDFGVVRFNANGTLDTSFGVGGEFYYDSGGAESLQTLTVAPDGKIVLATQVDGKELARIGTDGTLDATFGTGGFLGSSAVPIFGTRELLFQPDGKLLVAHNGDRALEVSRFNADFTLDGGFGVGGTASANFRSFASAPHLALQADGRIVVAGSASGDFAAARFYPDGVLDRGFGAEGIVLTNFGATDTATDVLVQGDGRIVAAGTSGGNFALARYVGGTSAGAFRWGSPAYNAAEDGGMLMVNVHRVNGMDGAVSVQYAMSDGTAHGGVDFTASSGTLNFAEREIVKTIAIPIADDMAAQGDRTFNLTLSNPQGGATLDTISTSVVTIRDDEVPGILALGAPVFTVDEGAGTAGILVVRTNGDGGAVSVDLTATSGTATAGDDFTFTTMTVNFAGGETSRMVSIPITNDMLVEGSESLALSLGNPQGGATLGALTNGELSIVDNDVPQHGALAFAATQFRADEGGGALTLAVRRSGGADGAVSVDVKFAGGSASRGLDYAADPTMTLNFAAGQAVATLAIPIIEDSLHEGDETVALSLVSPGGGATVDAKGAATLVIADNDPAPVSMFQFISTAFAAREGTGMATIAVARTGSTAGAATVHVTTSDGSAHAGGDYTAASFDLGFADGQGVKSFDIAIARDFLAEQDEAFRVDLSAPSGDGVPGQRSSAGVTILDDDLSSLADFNNDGRPDIASLRGAKMNVYLGNGDGTFGAAMPVPKLASPKGFVFGDFNGDGLADLAVLSAAKKSVFVLSGRGDGTFDLPVAFASGKATKNLVVADFNGDGRPDVAALQAKGVNVLLNDGRGGFAAPKTLDAGKSPASGTLLAGDFTGDGALDLALVRSGGKPTVALLAGNGHGRFGAPLAAVFAKGALAASITAGDFNADGRLDVAAIVAKNQIAILAGGAPGFGALSTTAGAKGAKLLAAGDFDGDLRLDLVTTAAKKMAAIIVQNGGGTFLAPALVAVDFTPRRLFVSDVDGDDDPDLVLLDAKDRVKVALGAAGSGFAV